jgi:RHS repeat-associated protein
VWNSSTFRPFNFSTSYYTHDGNKNVSEVINCEGDVSAHYEYDPFGVARIMFGEEAQSNPWRFSSEYAEDDSASVYYNFRHYEPNSSRWECRDPYGERVGLSLYCFLANRGDGVCDALGLDAIPAGVPVDEFFTNPANKKKYPLYKYVSVNAYEIVYKNLMGNFFSFIPWQKVELKEYYWRVEFTARFSPPLQLQVDKSYNSWGANALGGARDSYEPVSYVGDLPQDAWGMPTVSTPILSFAGYIIRQDFSFENKKFRFGYFVYKADCDGCEFSQIGLNPDMYSTWFKYAARKHPSDDLVADGHRTPCKTVVVLYGDAGRGTPSCIVFKGKWRSGK